MLDQETRKRSTRIGMRTILLSLGLSLTLVLAACGESSPTVTGDAPPADGAVVTETEGEVVEGEVVEDEVVEEDVETAEGAEVTEVITDTEVMTDTEVLTQTELVTETIVTEVITDTEVLTDTDVITESADAAQTEGVTETEEMTETEGTEAAPTPAPEEEGAGAADAAAAAAAGGLVGVTNAPDTYVRASTLTDYDFENVEGDDIGDIDDLLIDLNDGAVLFVAVEYGGFLDLGDREVYLPLSAFTIGQDGGMYLTMAEEELDAYPEVSDDWPNFDDPNWGAQLDEYWTSVGADAPDTANRDSANTVWASNLIGFPMLGWGDMQTNVIDVLINLQSGRAAYALIADNAMAADGPYIVPVQALTYDRQTEQLGFEGEMDPEALNNAPRFDVNTYPQGEPIGSDFGEGVDTYWRDQGFNWD